MVERVAAAIKEGLVAVASAIWGWLSGFDHFMVDFSGVNGRWTIYIIIAVLALILLMRILKLSFAILQKVVLPAALLSWVAGNFLPMPFFALFTVLVGLGSAWMLFKP